MGSWGGYEIFEEGQKSRSEFAREEQGRGKEKAEERVLGSGSYGPVVLWSCGPMVLWSYGPMVLWSYGPMVLWSYGPMVLWSYGPMVKAKSGTGESKALEKAGTSFLGARLRGKQKRKKWSWVLGPWSWEKKKQVKKETSFLEARLRGKAKAEKKERKKWSCGKAKSGTGESKALGPRKSKSGKQERDC